MRAFSSSSASTSSELDDVANTLMAVTFLRGVLPGEGDRTRDTSGHHLQLGARPARRGGSPPTTSKREIAAIAAHFEVLRIDGPDYRASSIALVESLDEAEVATVVGRGWRPGLRDDFDSLLAHLRVVRQCSSPPLVEGPTPWSSGPAPDRQPGATPCLSSTWSTNSTTPGITVAATGCGVHEFPSYRGGGYRKKYGRAESRLSAPLAEATGLTVPGRSPVTIDRRRRAAPG